jgi:hypothetical protein
MPHHFDPQILMLFSEIAEKFADVYDTLQ